MTNFDRALAVLESARRPGDLRIHPNAAVEAHALALPEADKQSNSRKPNHA